jgi:hypothetical protein
LWAGTDYFEDEFSFGKLFTDPVVKSPCLYIQRWPRDIDLRKGLLSGLWKDVIALVSNNGFLKFCECGKKNVSSGIIFGTSRQKNIEKKWQHGVGG